MIGVVEIGDSSPWREFFAALEPGTGVELLIDGAAHLTGTFSSTASWEDLEETMRFHGAVVTNDVSIDHWVPFDVIAGVILT